MGLSRQRAAFVEYYLRCWNGAEAARLAGYSERTARQAANKLLKDPAVKAAIAARLDELKMSADEVLTRLAEHARGSMHDFLRVSENGARLDLQAAAARNKLHLVKKFKRTKRTFGESVEVVEEIELYDAQNALALLGKHHRLFSERLEIDWRRELEQAGVNPDEVLDELAEQFTEHIRRGAEQAAGGSVEAGESAG